MEDAHNGLLCCVGEKPPICVSFTLMNIPADTRIVHVHTRLLRKSYLQTCLCLRTRKNMDAAPLLITTRMCPWSFESRLFAMHFKCFQHTHEPCLEMADQKALSHREHLKTSRKRDLIAAGL